MFANNPEGRLNPLIIRLTFLCCWVSPVLLFGQSGKHKPPHVDLLVTGATIVTMDPDRHVIEKGFIAVRGDEIVAMGSDASPLSTGSASSSSPPKRATSPKTTSAGAPASRSPK